MDDKPNQISGAEILARTLKILRIDTMFYIMGGPMLQVEANCIKQGIRAIDVRHEQAGAMMAHGWGRSTGRVAVCMGCSGPGTTNMVTGVATAWADAVPVLAIGGAAPLADLGGNRGIFQEIDQVAVFRPMTKMSERVTHIRRIPDMVATALRVATSGRPGPVYLDMPGDILYQSMDADKVVYPDPDRSFAKHRPHGAPEAVREAVDLLARAERPIILSGSGILWSGASESLRRFVEQTGVPFYTTPQGRGVLPDDHDLAMLYARSTAFQEADLLIVAATRSNYVNGHLSPPRFSASAKIIQINIDPEEIGLTRPCDVGIVGDAKAVLDQLADEAASRIDRARYSPWVRKLADINTAKEQKAEQALTSDKLPMHPLRLCKEVRDFLDRDAVLVVDGQEILNYARQSIPTFHPGHRINSGTMGTMGTGLPFGIGAKLAHPDKQVLVLHGDGSFGMSAMELDTAVRFNIPVVVVISLNGGWTADPDGVKPGRELGFTRYDLMAAALGCHAEYVEDPAQIRPALERAFKSGKPAVVNVKTDPMARAATAKFSSYTT
jgi:thiamine pyrophosphate-dependent acetolactate synthase large subunit-like protein